MKIVLQRVQSASVAVDKKDVGVIGKGVLLFLGIHRDDTLEKADVLIDKILKLRIFENDDMKMDNNILDVSGDICIVSQFTLYGNCKKGNRPSFTEAMPPAQAKSLYNDFIILLKKKYSEAGAGGVIATGQFGAMMEVSLINDGPVTFILEN